MYFYLAFFSSNVFEKLLSIYAKPLLYGYDLGKIQIKDIPIPDSKSFKGSNSNSPLYEKLVEYGKMYNAGNDILKADIDELVRQIYPLYEN